MYSFDPRFGSRKCQHLKKDWVFLKTFRQFNKLSSPKHEIRYVSSEMIEEKDCGKL